MWFLKRIKRVTAWNFFMFRHPSCKCLPSPKSILILHELKIKSPRFEIRSQSLTQVANYIYLKITRKTDFLWLFHALIWYSLSCQISLTHCLVHLFEWKHFCIVRYNYLPFSVNISLNNTRIQNTNFGPDCQAQVQVGWRSGECQQGYSQVWRSESWNLKT